VRGGREPRLQQVTRLERCVLRAHLTRASHQGWQRPQEVRAGEVAAGRGMGNWVSVQAHTRLRLRFRRIGRPLTVRPRLDSGKRVRELDFWVARVCGQSHPD